MRPLWPLTTRQIQIVLMAIAEVEGWDAQHPSIVSTVDGGWKWKNGLPVPSRKLMEAIRKKEKP